MPKSAWVCSHTECIVCVLYRYVPCIASCVLWCCCTCLVALCPAHLLHVFVLLALVLRLHLPRDSCATPAQLLRNSRATPAQLLRDCVRSFLCKLVIGLKNVSAQLLRNYTCKLLVTAGHHECFCSTSPTLIVRRCKFVSFLRSTSRSVFLCESLIRRHPESQKS